MDVEAFRDVIANPAGLKSIDQALVTSIFEGARFTRLREEETGDHRGDEFENLRFRHIWLDGSDATQIRRNLFDITTGERKSKDTLLIAVGTQAGREEYQFELDGNTQQFVAVVKENYLGAKHVSGPQ